MSRDSNWSELLRSAIRDSGRTTYALAKESGVPVQTVDRILTGQEPKLGTAEKIAAVVGLKLIKRSKGSRITLTRRRE